MDLTPEMAELLARRFAALGEPTRLRLLNLIHAEGEMTVGELVVATGGQQANVSKHLSVLLGARMVSRRRAGIARLLPNRRPESDGPLRRGLHALRDQLRELSDTRRRPSLGGSRK